MPFLMSPTIIAVIIAALLQAATLGWGFVQSNRADRFEAKLTTCQAQHKAFVEQAEAQGEAAKAKAHYVEVNNQRIADETAKDWAIALDVVRADAARRVRLATAASARSGAVPRGAEATGGANDAPQSTIPPPERVLADCTEDTLKLVWLQHWIASTR